MSNIVRDVPTQSFGHRAISDVSRVDLFVLFKLICLIITLKET